MRITERDTTLVVRDAPTALWLLGLVFVGSGLFVLLGATRTPEWTTFELWERLVIVAIGLGHLGGGLHTATRGSATRTVLDRASGTGAHEVLRSWELLPWRRRVRRASVFDLADVHGVELVQSRDSDGDELHQLRLLLPDSDAVWLQAQPATGTVRAEASAARVAGWLAVALRSGAAPATRAPLPR